MISDSDDSVSFELVTEETGEYNFFLRIEAEGGEVFTSEQKTFVSSCRDQSAGIQW